MICVGSLNPEFKYGRLGDFTEIHVGDAPSSSKTSLTKSHNVLDSLPTMSSDNVIGVTYRVHLLPTSTSPFRAYVWRSQLPIQHDEADRLYRIRKIREDRQHIKPVGPKFSKKVDEPKEFTVSF